jgi:TusA-related sulfurtransferase
VKIVKMQEESADRHLDITAETCPMTFVRTRLALDRMTSGQRLLVRLKGAEPRENVPKTAIEQGHTILTIDELDDGSVHVLIRKA